MKKAILGLTALAFVLAVVAPVFADDSPQEKGETKIPPLRTQVIQLKYTEAYRVQPVLNPFLSRDGQIRFAQPGDKILVVSDYAENVEKVIQAVKQIDMKPSDILFTVQLVLGSEGEETGGEPMQNDPIIRELRNLLKYKSYSLLDTSIIRAMDGGARSDILLGKKADFQLSFRPKVFKDEKTAYIQIELALEQRIPIQIVLPANNSAVASPGDRTNKLIVTTLSIKSGDKTVVGVSKLDGGDKGLILIISGKIVD